MIFDDNSKIIFLSNLHKNLCCGCSLEFIKTYVVGAH